jgi:cytochrome c biogenesis protein CcmG/thiol:disulfide interchange protein DsbE
LNHTRNQMRSRVAIPRTATTAILLAATLALASCAGCGGSGDDVDPGSANPDSAATEYEGALAGAPKPLAALYAKGDALIEGGPDAFEAQLAKLRGYPVVVNKWASWCGPCRYEFPFFQEVATKRGDEIAFVGVNANDSADAAQTFLDELPLPYPSISDPDNDVGKLFDGFSFPSTALYDAEGELQYTRQGPYESAQDLSDEIDRYLN